MGHSADGSNRLKANKALRTKVNFYEKIKDYSKEPPLKIRFNFKTPTTFELEKLEASNLLFLQKQKKRNRIILMVGFTIAIAFIYWITETVVWEGYLHGFGRYAG